MFLRLDGSTTHQFPPCQTSLTTLLILMSTSAGNLKFLCVCVFRRTPDKVQKRKALEESPQLRLFVECHFDIHGLHWWELKGHVK